MKCWVSNSRIILIRLGDHDRMGSVRWGLGLLLYLGIAWFGLLDGVVSNTLGVVKAFMVVQLDTNR